MDYNTEKKQRGAKAKQPPRNMEAEAVQAHAELNLAGIPSRSLITGEKLTLIERIRLIPGVMWE